MSSKAPLKFSEQIASAREKLLRQFQLQIEITHDNDNLKPFNSIGQEEPFICFESNPPQIAAIKKLINALYHAEEAIKKWENMDTSSYSGKALAVKQAYDGLSHLFKSLALLNDVTPEIQALVANNYSLLEPIFNRAHELIKEKGWESQFSNLDVVGSAQTMIDKSLPYLSDEENYNPLISFFSDLSSLIKHIKDFQNPAQDKSAQRETLKKLAEHFESNPITKNLSFQSIEESNAINTFMSWLKTLKEYDYELKEETIKAYVDWANQSLPGMILFIDRIEQSNYLKSGILSGPVLTQLDELSRQINSHIEQSELDNLEKVKSTSDFTELRVEQIHHAQQDIVAQINQIEDSRQASYDFFSLLTDEYTGRNFADIQESDRQILRSLYAKMQEGMAHVDLELDSKLVEVLNTKGPDTIPTQGYLRWGASFVFKNSEIDKLIDKEIQVNHFYYRKRDSENYKFSVYEKARARLDGEIQEDKLYERVKTRLEEINGELPSKDKTQETTHEPLKPYKASHLKNLRGNVAYLQELGLSKKIQELRGVVSTLCRQNLDETDQAYFSTLPHKINPKEPDYIGKIKSLENALFNLERALDAFEHLGRNQSYWQLTRSLITLADAAMKVSKNINTLPPAIQNILAPVFGNIAKVSSSLTDLNANVSELTAVLPPLDLDATIRDAKSLLDSWNQMEVTPLPDLEKEISNARDNLLKLFKDNLSPALAEKLIPNSDPREVPFIINIDTEPPQLLALKRVINSMYHAEQAVKKWNQMQFNPNSLIDQARMLNKGLLILSDVNNAITSLSEVGPEVQELLKTNYGLIEPMMNGVQQWFSANEWLSNLTGSQSERIATLGSLLGQSINAFKPGTQPLSSSQTLVGSLVEIPRLIKTATTLLDRENLREKEPLISQEGQRNMAELIDLWMQDKSTSINYIHAAKGLLGYVKLAMLVGSELKELHKTGAEKYQDFLNEHYPNIVLFLTEVEVKNYLKPGTLTTPFCQQIEAFTQKLETPLRLVTLKIPDVDSQRLALLQELRASNWKTLDHLSNMQNAASNLFKHLEQHTEKTLDQLSKNDLQVLREQFAVLQDSFADVDLKMRNLLVEQLNQLETVGAQPGAQYISIKDLIDKKDKLNTHLSKQTASTQLQIEVIHRAMESLGPVAEHALSPQQIDIEKNNLRQHRETVPIPGPGNLEPTRVTSAFNMESYLHSFQEVKLSARLHSLAEEFTRISQSTLSDKVIQQLGERNKDGLYPIHDNEPLVVKQLKIVENAFVKLENSLKTFESMRKEQSLFTQGITLLAIAEDAKQLTDEIAKLSPDMARQCQSVTTKVSNLSQYISSLQSQTKSELSTSEPEKPLPEQAKEQETSTYQNMSNSMAKVATALDNLMDKMSVQYPQLDHTNTEPSQLEDESQKPLNLKDVIKQFAELLVKIKKTGQESNQALTENFISLKERAYESLVELSKMEDDLCLKPGTLTDDAIKGINDLFNRVSLELDTMPFEEKLKLIDDSRYLEILIQETQNDVIKIQDKLKASPEDNELALQLQIKQDKIEYLDRIKKSLPNEVERTKELLDNQFEVLIRRAVSKSGINNDFIRKQLADDLRNEYLKEKNTIIKFPPKEIVKELNNLVDTFNDKNIAKYHLVNRTSNLFTKFQKRLSDDNKGLKDYIGNLIKEDLHGDRQDGVVPSIDERVARIQKLPHDPDFKSHMFSVKEGLGVFKKFSLLIDAFIRTVKDKKDESSLSNTEDQNQSSYSKFKNTYKELKVHAAIHSVINQSQQYKEEMQSGRKEYEQTKESTHSKHPSHPT